MEEFVNVTFIRSFGGVAAAFDTGLYTKASLSSSYDNTLVWIPFFTRDTTAPIGRIPSPSTSTPASYGRHSSQRKTCALDSAFQAGDPSSSRVKLAPIAIVNCFLNSFLLPP